MHTYKVNTGHEAALEREVARLKGIIAEGNNIIDEGKDDRATLVKKLAVMTDKYDRMKGYADQLLDENGTMEAQYDEAKTNMALMSDEIAELEKSYKNECHETQVYKKAWREQRELVALRDDQIAMLKRQIDLSK